MTPMKSSWRILRDKKGEPTAWILRVNGWTRGVIVSDGDDFHLCFVAGVRSEFFRDLKAARSWVKQEVDSLWVNA